MKKLILTVLAVLGALQISKGDTVCRYDAAEEQAHCYSLTEAATTWEAANTACGEGKYLAAIESAAEQTFIDDNLVALGIADGNEAWFGAKYVTFTGEVWRWASTSDEEAAMGEITWGNGEPIEGNDAATLRLVDGGVDPDTWVVHHENPESPHYVLCEAANEDDREANVEFAVGARYYHGFAEEQVSWEAANVKCLEANAWLAEVETEAHRLLVEAGLKGQDTGEVEDFWIGLHVGEWQWPGESAIDFAHENWADAEPGSLGCGYITNNGGTDAQWAADHDCTKEAPPAGVPGLCEEVVEDTSEPACRLIEVEGETLQQCIQLTADAAEWANDACPEGQSLLEINDEEELAFVDSRLPRLGVENTNSLWIGAQARTFNWKWVADDAEKAETGFTWENPVADETNIVAMITDATASGTYLFNKEVRTQTHHVLCEIATDVAIADESFRFTAPADRHYVGFTEAGDSVSWEAARAMCDEITETEAWLATVDDDTVLTAISGHADMPDDGSFWIGLRRAQWEWLEGGLMEEEYPWAVNQPTTGCAFMTYSAADLSTEWSSDPDCGTGTAKKSVCEITQDAPEEDDPQNGDDGGLSDGEIAAIAVSSTVVVGGAAAGGGYYAYSKKSSGKVGADAEAGGEPEENYQKEEEDEEKQEGDEREQQEEDPAPVET